MRPQTARRSVALAIQAALYLGVHGCTAVSGGAVELSWKLRGASGSDDSFIDCDANGALTNDKGPIEGVGRVVDIQIAWDQNGSGGGNARFRCADGHGITGFTLPPGDVALTVSPICSNGNAADPSTYSAPAPVLRSVTAGNTVSLGAVEMVLQIDCSLGGHCICL